MKSNKNAIERRIASRQPYSGHIFFATKSQLFEGVLKNYSRHGLFITTGANLILGEFIIVALPYLDSGQSKVQGQVLWRNHEGYGVELTRKQNGENFKLLKIEARFR